LVLCEGGAESPEIAGRRQMGSLLLFKGSLDVGVRVFLFTMGRGERLQVEVWGDRLPLSKAKTFFTTGKEAGNSSSDEIRGGNGGGGQLKGTFRRYCERGDLELKKIHGDSEADERGGYSWGAEK